jgi:hypothetical protein
MWATATLVAEPDTDSEQRVRRFALSPLLSCLDVPSSPSDRRRDGYCARLQPRVGVPYRDHAVNRERPAYSTASIHDASAPDRSASAARKAEKATPRRAGIREVQSLVPGLAPSGAPCSRSVPPSARAPSPSHALAGSLGRYPAFSAHSESSATTRAARGAAAPGFRVGGDGAYRHAQARENSGDS